AEEDFRGTFAVRHQKQHNQGDQEHRVAERERHHEPEAQTVGSLGAKAESEEGRIERELRRVIGTEQHFDQRYGAFGDRRGSRLRGRVWGKGGDRRFGVHPVKPIRWRCTAHIGGAPPGPNQLRTRTRSGCARRAMTVAPWPSLTSLPRVERTTAVPAPPPVAAPIAAPLPPPTSPPTSAPPAAGTPILSASFCFVAGAVRPTVRVWMR